MQFEEVSSRLSHVPVDHVDDDGTTQPLLPRRLSQAGPGVSWVDLNGDGHADLVIPSGRGGALGVFFGDGKGKIPQQVFQNSKKNHGNAFCSRKNCPSLVNTPCPITRSPVATMSC